MKLFLYFYRVLISLAVFTAYSSTAIDFADVATWKPEGDFSKAENHILITDVPSKNAKGQHWMERECDLVPFRGKQVTFMVKYRCSNVSKPPEPWNGIKFMLRYKPSSDAPMQWPGGNGMYGTDNEWQWTGFSVTFPKTVTTGILSMGLENSSGQVEFDLSTLRIGSLFSEKERINQDWKVQYPESVASHPRQRGMMSPHKITYDDMKTLNKWNVNLVRAQISRNWGAVGTELDLEEYDRWLAGKLDNLEQAMEWGREFGIKFVIDLHCPPGGRNTQYNMRMFIDKNYGDHFIEVWKRIAGRFKKHPQLYAYDLINEPVQAVPALPGYDYWNLQRRAAEAVREIDPDTPIMIESNESDRPQTFSYLSPLRMHNIIYKVHMYFPLSYTHQRLNGQGPAITYPGQIEGVMWNRERIRETLQPVIDFQKRHNCKIYVGEFSAIAWAPGAEKFLNDCIEVFEELGWDWTYHSFRESPVWNVEMAGDCIKNMKPVKSTPRQKVLLQYFQRNKKSK
ncbi:glycoside hydrolase family 5 protein [Victivallis vadensis]|uniref:glycoside hydrolase family 5 protein n=1 Tax=Victivallis vadensis TaxID=172901 RepID=UPI003AF596C0